MTFLKRWLASTMTWLRQYARRLAAARLRPWFLLSLLLLAGVIHAGTIGLSDGSVIQGQLTSAVNGECVITRANGSTVALQCSEIASYDSKVMPEAPRASPALPPLPIAGGVDNGLKISGSNTVGAKLMPALVAEYLNTRGARDVQTLVKGPEDIVIEPQPPIAAVWRQIQILSHGTSSGFKSLAARLELPSLGSTRTEKREAPEQKASQGSEDAIMAMGLPSSNGAANSALEEAMMRAPIGVIEARRNVEPSPRVPAADEPAREPAAPALVSKSSSGADIAMASRRITPAEITALQRLGQMDHPSNEHVIALDGLAVVINRSNRLESLSIEEIARIFSGSVTDWSELGGSPGPISIYARNAGSGTMDTFSALVLKGLPLTPTAQRIEDSRELAAAVAANRSAIGFVGMPYIGATKALGIRECGLVYQPNSFNTKTEEYPLSRRLFLYTPAKRSPEVQDFLNFVSRPIAQRVIDANGFVDLSVEPDFSGEQRRLRLSAPEGIQRRVDEGPYMSLMRSGGRLSVTLRFRSNTADLSRPDLDTRAIRDIERIQDFFRDASGKPRRITLVGFTDSVGNPDNNRALSLGRAQSVATQLRGLPVVRVLGLGAAFPVACNVTDEGRSKNRRVEIWVDG